jgi:hypothetical protein
MELALQGAVNKSRFFLLLGASKSMRFEIKNHEGI